MIPEGGAVFAVVQDFCLKWLACVEGGTHQLSRGRVGAGALQQFAAGLSEQFLAAVSGQAHEGVVDVDQFPLEVADGDAFLYLVQGAVAQPEGSLHQRVLACQEGQTDHQGCRQSHAQQITHPPAHGQVGCCIQRGSAHEQQGGRADQGRSQTAQHTSPCHQAQVIFRLCQIGIE